MKKVIFAALLVPGLFALGSCENMFNGPRTCQVEFTCGTADNAAGDAAFDFTEVASVAYTTEEGGYETASMTHQGPGRMSGSFELKSKNESLWCFTKPENSVEMEYTVPAGLVKNGSSAVSFDGMVFCSNKVDLKQKEALTGTIKPITSAIVLDILDSRGKQCGKPFTMVTMKGADGVSVAGDFKLRVQESRIGELSNTSSTLDFNCASGDLKVGTADNPASIGAVVLPCAFTGTVTVVGDGFKATFTIGKSQTLQAGYIKHIKLDLADAQIEGEKQMPKRLGILGDSISTFEGMIPSTHKKYYPTTNTACADVDKWEKTYWGHLINDYWHCELDINSSWSGSCVAAGDPTVVRTPFVERCGLFKNPDVIILFGGTNDCQAERKIALGEFDYTSTPDKLNKYARFRESYIWVIKTLQASYPDVQIICIVGNHIEGEYGNSVKAIAEHMGLPCVDFRGDQKVTLYEQLHPNAAGHAHMAERIYQETLSLFQ